MSYNELLNKIPTSLYKPGSDLHKLIQMDIEALDEISARIEQIRNLRDIDSLSGIHLTNAGKIVRARGRNLNESDASYKTIIDLENLRTSANGSIPDIIRSLNLISTPQSNYTIHEGFKFGLPGVLRVAVPATAAGFLLDEKFLYAIENHNAPGIRYSVLNDMGILGSEMILKTVFSLNGWDNTVYLDNLQVFHEPVNNLNIHFIALGDGAEPGGILRPAEQEDTALQSERIRVPVTVFNNPDGGCSYLGTILPEFGGFNINEIGAFNDENGLVTIKSFPSIMLSNQINNDFMITEDYHA
jgi:hypothetical protein